MFARTDPAAEVLLQLGGELQPGRCGDADQFQDRRQVIGDGAPLVVAYRPSGPVDPLQIVRKVDRQAFRQRI